jgi:DNA repair exonuclease SbcCD ATPase subunit
MIKFKQIRWSNFLSTGQYATTVDLCAATTTLISGENGAGKSTLLDALTFALFGKPYRNINKPQLVNSVNEKACLVELDLEIGPDKYNIRRGLEPALFEIYKNSKLVDQDAKSKDYQKMFEEQVLKMSYKAFCQVVILGSANYVPFMRLTAAERRAVVEAILDINIFSTMNTLLKGKLSKLKEELAITEADTNVEREKVRLNLKYLENKDKDSTVAADQCRADIGKCTEDEEVLIAAIARLDKQISERHEQITDSDTVSKSINDLGAIHRQLKGKIKTITNEIEFYQKNDSCPTCSQHIDPIFKSNVVDTKTKKSKEIGEAVEDIQDSMSKANERLTEINTVLSDIRGLETKRSQASASLQATVSNRKKLEARLTELETTKRAQGDADEKELAKLQEGLRELEDTRKEMVDDQYYYGIASALLKDSGIKSRIIKHYIPVINQIINRYLNQMGLFVSFNLDEEFNETIKSRHRDIFTYSSFSEGEKRKIDLALLFAWRTIASLKNSLDTNLLIMDEVLDGSLDDASVESFLEILRGIGGGTNAFVISHKPKELLESKFTSHITFIKKNNFSQIA